MPAWTTPELWPLWCRASASSCSRTTTRVPGRRRRTSRPTASPRIPPPTMPTVSVPICLPPRKPGVQAGGLLGPGPREVVERVVPAAREHRGYVAAERVGDPGVQGPAYVGGQGQPREGVADHPAHRLTGALGERQPLRDVAVQVRRHEVGLLPSPETRSDGVELVGPEP